MRKIRNLLAATVLLITGLAVGGVTIAFGSSPPPASGQSLAIDNVSGVPASATASSLSVSWSYRDQPGDLWYYRPCGLYVTTTPSTPPAGAATIGLGEDATSWQGDVDVAPGQTLYVSLTLSRTGIGVDAHDCTGALWSTGVSSVAVAAYSPPTSAPPPPPAPPTTPTQTVTVTTTVADPDVDARLTALEQRQAVDEARITELEKKIAILGEPKNVMPFTRDIGGV